MKKIKFIAYFVFISTIIATVGCRSQFPSTISQISGATIKRVIQVDKEVIILEDVQKHRTAYTFRNINIPITLCGNNCNITRINHFRLGIYQDKNTILFYDGIPLKNDYVEEIVFKNPPTIILVPGNLQNDNNLKRPIQMEDSNIIISNPNINPSSDAHK